MGKPLPEQDGLPIRLLELAMFVAVAGEHAGAMGRPAERGDHLLALLRQASHLAYSSAPLGVVMGLQVEAWALAGLGRMREGGCTKPAPCDQIDRALTRHADGTFDPARQYAAVERAFAIDAVGMAFGGSERPLFVRASKHAHALIDELFTLADRVASTGDKDAAARYDARLAELRKSVDGDSKKVLAASLSALQAQAKSSEELAAGMVGVRSVQVAPVLATHVVLISAVPSESFIDVFTESRANREVAKRVRAKR